MLNKSTCHVKNTAKSVPGIIKFAKLYYKNPKNVQNLVCLGSKIF